MPATTSPSETAKGDGTTSGYATERLKRVQAKVEAMLPDQTPDLIGLLRLGTDCYQ